MSATKTPFSSDDGNGTLVIGAGGHHDPKMEARVAVLEEIATTTKSMLAEMRIDVKAIRDKQEADYRSLAGKIVGETLKLYAAGALAAAAVLGVLAHGFKWI